MTEQNKPAPYIVKLGFQIRKLTHSVIDGWMDMLSKLVGGGPAACARPLFFL